MASIQRIALFVFFDSVEADLVSRIRSIPNEDGSSLLSEDERDKAKLRLEKISNIPESADDGALLHGLDIGDKYSVLMRNAPRLPKATRDYYKSLKNSFEKVIPVRNAVMHGRPLTVSQHTQAFAFASDLVKAAGYWPTLAKSFQDYDKDPEGIIKAAKISFIEGETPGVFHNLPSPDYDDTGFIPRDALQADLRKKILGRHPVITVLGDGGDGKTSISLQCLHDLIASNDHPFDGIVWVSAKSNRLGIKEVERIEGSILDSMDLFRSVSNTFGEDATDPLERVWQLLDSNKILLVIDNLETVLDDSIKKFAENVPGESKVLFTSRVPLGSDLTVKVGPFSTSESIKLLRALASSYNINSLQKWGNDKLASYSSRLFNKPLLLKWFALGVSSGLSPDRIVANPDKALSFCLENVIGSLSSDARRLAGVLAVVPGPISVAVLSHVVDFSAKLVESTVAELLRFGLLEQTDDRIDQTYRLRNFARSYISRQTNLKPKDAANIISSLRSVDSTYNHEMISAQHDRYNMKTYVVASKSDAVAVQKLRNAAMACLRDDFSLAEAIIEDLKITNPNYFEVFRVEAFIAARQLDYPRARICYEVAVEIGGDQPQLRYFYSMFLSRDLHDFPAAYQQIIEALNFDPNSYKLRMEASRSAISCLDFSDAKMHLNAIDIEVMRSINQASAIIDLSAHFYTRSIIHGLDKLRIEDAAEYVDDMLAFLRSVNAVDLDMKNLETFSRLANAIRRLSERDQNCKKLAIDECREILISFDPHYKMNNEPGTDLIVGKLKIEGRQTSFAFIDSSDGIDTFVHRSDVEPHVWDEMCMGRFVKFARLKSVDGKMRAERVALF